LILLFMLTTCDCFLRDHLSQYQAVQLTGGTSGKTVTAVARELGISSESLRGWYRTAKADRGEGAPGELSSAEREELRRLRRENREQQQTIEILKKATAFFVKENDR
ncbi:transposase, partial [Streptomyces sp. NPDC086010]|uniref:transposase n=1 Tax=Streptomyces sp. NPDC086010 TaxID=3365745 RepID=UPI0037D2717F